MHGHKLCVVLPASNPASLLQERRREEFVHTKRQIIKCMEELEHVPDTSFEQDVVCEDEEAFCLSTENIAALKELLQQVGARALPENTEAPGQDLLCGGLKGLVGALPRAPPQGLCGGWSRTRQCLLGAVC